MNESTTLATLWVNRPPGLLVSHARRQRTATHGRTIRYGPNTYFLGGELDMASAPILIEAVGASLASGGANLLDLGALTFIDSTGIHTIRRSNATLVAYITHADVAARLAPRRWRA